MNKVMKSLAGVFSLWGRKQANGASSKTENGSTTNSTWLGEQRTSDFKKRIKQRQDEERKRLEKWKKEFKKMSNYTYAPNTPVFNNITSGSISTTTRLGDSKVTIDGGENGSMRVDVPLLVDGRDVMRELDEMRDALLLLKRDVDMEAKYPKLRELKDAYEAQLEKYKTFEALK